MGEHNKVMQQTLIVVLVAAAGGYVVWSFLSIARRQQLLDALAARGLLREVAARHRAVPGASGCGNCGAQRGSGPLPGGPKAK